MADIYALGIDIGSATSKCVLLRNSEIIATSLYTAGTGTAGPKNAYAAVLGKAGLLPQDVSCAVATGYGRKLFQDAHDQMSEITCHARGANYLFPGVRTVIDIGGQDAKVIRVNESGKVTGFVMNDKCAAGTGRFLDVMATVLQVNIGDMETRAGEAEYPVKISSTCTVFAESEVISQLSAGEKINNIVAGICDSVAARAAALAKRIGIAEDVCMSGGVAKNGGVRCSMAQILRLPVLYSPLAQHGGALGAALYALDKYEKRGG